MTAKHLLNSTDSCQRVLARFFENLSSGLAVTAKPTRCTSSLFVNPLESQFCYHSHNAKNLPQSSRTSIWTRPSRVFRPHSGGLGRLSPNNWEPEPSGRLPAWMPQHLSM
jgi:hypothetical protein